MTDLSATSNWASTGFSPLADHTAPDDGVTAVRSQIDSRAARSAALCDKSPSFGVDQPEKASSLQSIATNSLQGHADPSYVEPRT